ncbi:endoglucanase [Allocatelliglobosispora scoriae]|uniref:Endoglucanase n=1 Tax=Allocatelliglobosispora scoriae TaxID=643052 RepID=A0A841BU84_9ACTN|nr:cellulase family glycosylhydrolase [Allocatelliglobosispora scoriae]MBB5871764.1 endoglucanase [Allocatelliglobosispora scoriae]
MQSRALRSSIGAAVATALVAAAAAVSFSLVTAGPANAAGTGIGYLHTSGNKIVDSTGATVRLTGINWFGMETDNRTFHGLWASVTWKSQIDHMAQLGYNTLRVPWSNDAVKPGATASGINDFTNPDLVGLSPLQILDKVIAYAGTKGMRIILDRHRPTAAGQSALWYVAATSEATMIADWKAMATRYAGNTTVIGADLHNEPHAEGTNPAATGACWGCGVETRDWRLAAERIGNAVLGVQPNWLIFVEGVSCPSGGLSNVWDGDTTNDEDCGWWGGNLSKAGQFPVRLSVANRLVYSPHEYGVSVYRQAWFDDPAFPANLPAIWDKYWGYLYKQNIAPIMLGEFGSTLADPKDTVWLTNLMSYLGTGVNGMSFTYWSWNPNSGDTGGIVSDDWVTVNQAKQNILQPYLIPPSGQTSPIPTVSDMISPSASRSASASPSPSRSTSPSASPSPSRSTSPSPNPGGGCQVTYKVDSAWPQGFNATVTVKNTSSATVNNWVLTFTVPSGVTLANGWNATWSSSGTTFTATAPTYAANLAPGATVTPAFTGNGASTPAPSAFKLNGVTCS